MMMYGKIDGWDIETEIEKGFTKCRYSKMKKSEERNNEILDLETKTLNYGKVIATNLPTVQSLNMPRKLDLDSEQKLSTIKRKMIEKFDDYQEKYCDRNGFPQSNLTKSEIEGIKEIKDKVKNKNSFKAHAISDNVKDALKKRLKSEYELYSFIKQKLFKQYANL